MNKSVNSLQLTFDDKTVLVTGGGHGIGRSICKEFARFGANVASTDILAEQLAETERETNQMITELSLPGGIRTYACDLTDSPQIERLIDQVVKDFGTIDILVNVAGGVVGQTHQPVEEVTDEQWKKIVNVNLDATFYTIRAVAPIMKKKGYGRIVNISSGAGRSSSLTGIQAYTSAKAGQIGLTRQMARELGPYGITVNNIAPGFVLSNPSTQKQWETMTEEEQERLIQSISVKRLGEPEDIAHPVLFFASDFARYVSGQVISADGGLQLF